MSTVCPGIDKRSNSYVKKTYVGVDECGSTSTVCLEVREQLLGVDSVLLC